MADLIEQLYASLAFLLPGFVALHAGYRVYGLQARMTDLEKSTWSLFLSLGVLGFYMLATDQHMSDLAADPASFVTPANLFALMLIVGLATGIVILWLFLKPLELLNRLFWRGRKDWTSGRTPWDIFLGASLQHGVVVETTGRKVYGRLVGYGWVEDEKALRVLTKHTVEWDEATKQETLRPYETDMLIPYEQVISVVRVEAPT